MKEIILDIEKLNNVAEPLQFLAEQGPQKEEGNEIIFITARFSNSDFNIDVENITKYWLLQNDIPYDKLIINANEKQKVAIEEKIDVFLDDSIRNCEMNFKQKKGTNYDKLN